MWARYGPAGPTDTLPARPDPDRDLIEPLNGMACRRPNGDIPFFVASYDPRIGRVPAPGSRIVETDPVGYRLVLMDLRGDTLRIVEYETPDAFVTDAQWSAELGRFDEFIADAGRCPRTSIERPERRPLVASIQFDDRGRMWIRRRGDDGDPGRRFDVFNTAGLLLARIDVPGTDRIAQSFVRNDRLHLVSSDSLGLQSIRVYDVLDTARAR